MSAPAISSSESPPKRPKTIDMNEEINCLKETIKTMEADLRGLSGKIGSVSERRRELLDKKERTKSELDLIAVIAEDLHGMRERKDRLVESIATHEAELRELKGIKEPVNTSAPDCVLEPFKFVGIEQINDMFPRNSFGTYVLHRRRVVDSVMDSVTRQGVSRKFACRSVYLCGCRAMGKTCTLTLIGDQFLQLGSSVFYLQTLAFLEVNIYRRIVELLKDETKTIVILVDEIGSRTGSSFLGLLLKMSNPRLIIVGAAVPSNLKSTNPGNFRYIMQMSDLVLKKTDTDYIDFVGTIFELMARRAPLISFEVCSDICDFILEYCGGHVYPTLHLISYFFTTLSPEHLQSLAVFQHILFSPEFENSEDFCEVKNRCFDHDITTKASVDRIMRGIGNDEDLDVVDHLGWWNSETNDFISTMLKNVCLTIISKTIAPKITLVCDEDHSLFSNTISMLIAGFSDMTADDFKCMHNIAVDPIENALSHSWSKRVLMKYSNVYMKAQINSPNSGYADFYVNGACSCIVEFIRNATQATCNEHLSRFLSGKYPWKNFIIVNFAMKGPKIVLPTNQNYHNIVFTYVHSENTLYCGNTAIKSPAVSSLESAAPIDNLLPISNFIEAGK